jgi:hypothetical protein
VPDALERVKSISSRVSVIEPGESIEI